MDKELKLIISLIDSNLDAGLPKYEGLESHEIGRYSRYLMYGPNPETVDEAEYRINVD